MNEVINSTNTIIMDSFQKTDNILNDVQNIIEVSQKEAYRTVNRILTQRNWLIGYRIAEEELISEQRAEYGAEVIKKLSKELTAKYGKGFTKTNLYSFYRFYKCFPEIFHTACGKSNMYLSWSHYRTLLQVHDETARKWYEKELANNTEDTPQELQRKYPHYDELVDDLIDTNMRMIEYKNLMKGIAFPGKQS